jgi:fructokinase
MASALEAVAAELAGSALVSVDPNIRPWVIGDEDAYRERLRRVLRPQPRREGQRGGRRLAVPRPARAEARAGAARRRPGVALLTRGGEGCSS